MDRKLIFNLLSKMMVVESALLVIPAVISLCYGEFLKDGVYFIIVAAATCLVFLPLAFLTKQPAKILYAREAFSLVALCWVLWSLIGALPFLLSGTLTNYIDCIFEATSGFTTTGATVFEDVECLPHGILLWRSLMHWVGGMGVLVLALAVLPMTGGGNYMNLFRAEMTGSEVGKLVPKAKKTAFILYAIYTAMTVALTVLLILGGMPVFDSINHAMSTAGTGGMSVKNASIGAYDSTYIDIVVTVFMFMMGVNFTLYFMLLKGKVKDFFKSAELRFYAIEFVIVSLLIALVLRFKGGEDFFHALRLSTFQAASLMSSTGYATADTNVWVPIAKVALIICMLIGACAGSTGGGIKVSRIQIAGKTIARDVKRQINPRYVCAVRSEGKPVDNPTINAVMTFIASYFAILFASVAILAATGINFETGFTSVVSGLSNMGPFFSEGAATTSNYMFMPYIAKIVLSADMLLGRLEIFPFLILFSRSTINRKLF